jgi:hypothetical protein
MILFSDHRYIAVLVGDVEVTKLIYHNPKRANWKSYQEDLKGCTMSYTLGARCRAGC